MKEEKYFCDRCNKEIQKEDIYHITNLPFFRDNIELCRSCYKSFKWWLKMRGGEHE